MWVRVLWEIHAHRFGALRRATNCIAMIDRSFLSAKDPNCCPKTSESSGVWRGWVDPTGAPGSRRMNRLLRVRA